MMILSLVLAAVGAKPRYALSFSDTSLRKLSAANNLLSSTCVTSSASLWLLGPVGQFGQQKLKFDVAGSLRPLRRCSERGTTVRLFGATAVSDGDQIAPPWNNRTLAKGDDLSKHDGKEATSFPGEQSFLTTKQRRNSRFRQHVNPLSRKFQVPCELGKWPSSVYDDAALPLFLDIGSGKGGFLLELATSNTADGGTDESSLVPKIRTGSIMHEYKRMNYLGLEIRPGVAEYAQNRVAKRNLGGILSFIGCNVNVDLDRILTLYQSEQASNRFHEQQSLLGEEPRDGRAMPRPLRVVAIQFPDPHFKKSHTKRRVVNADLVHTLANHTDDGAIIFLQSDVQDVLDDMRLSFREHGKEYFVDSVDEMTYLEENPIGIPTEREVSVLKQSLPIFRALFRRNAISFV